MAFIFEPLKIPEVKYIKPLKFLDRRGFFLKLYNKSEFLKNGINYDFVEDSISQSDKYVLRGLHYQIAPNSEGKIVHVIKGKIFDVVVDLRKESKTFGKWLSINLSGDSPSALWIPPGFAHGFMALKPETLLLYKMTAHYDEKSQRGILWSDKQLSIKWPTFNPILSERDSKFPELKDAEINYL